MDQSMNENLCALTFDDGPSKNTPMLLDLLKSYNIPATFFLLGSQIAQYPEMVSKIQSEGHEIGSHSWSHPNLRLVSLERLQEEILNTDELLKSLGAVPLYLRPPYGAYDDRVIQLADRLGISIILWSLDSRDWKNLPSDYAKLRSTRGTVYDDGALRGIFLFHDTHKSTVDDLPRIIANLRAGGCERFVTVSEYLAGIADPEPSLVMKRKNGKKQPEPEIPMYAADFNNVPLARCSKPAFNQKKPINRDDMEMAHVSANSLDM